MKARGSAWPPVTQDPLALRRTYQCESGVSLPLLTDLPWTFDLVKQIKITSHTILTTFASNLISGGQSFIFEWPGFS